jgi:peptide deformylase
MAVRNVVKYPEKSLSQPSVKVDVIDEGIKELIKDMEDTMFHDVGVGLAAPQIGINKRVIVYDSHAMDPEYAEETREITPLINPEIIASYGSFISEDEGCLSVVDYRANVKRYEKVTVKALNIDGKKLEFDADGILSVIMQHEIDHLDGILFIDRISSLKRAMYKKKRMKELKNQE